MMRFNEVFARNILSTVFGNLYGPIEVRDKPDLWCIEKNIGIEVTHCINEREAEGLNLLLQVLNNGGKGQERNIERLLQLGYDFTPDQFWVDNGPQMQIKETPVDLLIKTIQLKTEKLNSTKSNYQKMDRYDLFVNSTISLSEYGKLFDLAQRVAKELASGEGNRFTRVYLLTLENKLIVMENTIQSVREYFIPPLILESCQKEARKESRKMKNEQT